MATIYKIHPAIGIGRVGNSPDGFFIGPERVGERPQPAGGFKDAQCRVKRQAARFRIFGHHDDGTVEEITDVEAEIAWTVHLANKKASNPGRGNTEAAADLDIDPGARTLSGPDQRAVFDSGVIRFSGEAAVAVPLGEIRTDDQGRLLVLGGFGTSASPPGSGISSFWGNEDWYDDVSDGPVRASIKLRAGGETPPVVGAWVIAAPPKFAPHMDSPITLFDRVLQAMVDGGLAAAPGATSYSKDVFPVLQRARDIRWVETIGTSPHAWIDPVTDEATRIGIFSRLGTPAGGGDMPQLNDSGTGDNNLTATQYAHMERWKNNDYFNDWAGVPPPEASVTPDGLDRAALEACAGGSFFPGIEAGGLDASSRPILDPANYAAAFRLDHAVVSPGDITYTMALPWQADFLACADNWWPVPRPNEVFPQGQTTRVEWDRDIGDYEEMVARWHTLGFVVTQGSRKEEIDRCEQPSIALLTPHLDFVDVPQGPMGMVREQSLAITFEVIAPSAGVTLEYAPGGGPSHPQLVGAVPSVTVGPATANQVVTARLWVIYRTGAAPSAIDPQTVTVREPASGQTWEVTITGNTVARKTAAVALVLDRSGSMGEDRGDGQSKHASLQQAASIFVDLMLEGDGAALVRYNDDAQVLQPVLPLGGGGLSDLNRNATRDLIAGNGLDPQGATSIGDGIFEGRGALQAATQPFDVKALVVLTDGKENRARYIHEVAPQIDARTYAIGLGTPQNTSAPALQTVSGNTGGFLLVSGAIAGDNRFLLQKYFLEILAGISNAEVVLDPQGRLLPGQVQRVPFLLTEADAGVDVILLTPDSKIVDFRLQTPTGLILEPWRAQGDPGMRFVLSGGVSCYRLALPVQLQANRFDQSGLWHALLTLGHPRLQPTPGREDGVDRGIVRGIKRTGLGRAAVPRVRNEKVRAFNLARQPGGPPVASAAAGAAAASGAGATGAAAGRAVPYSLVVHSYSSISLQATAEQSGWEPGDRAHLQATLTEAGIPARADAQVWAEVELPGGGHRTVPLALAEPGTYAGELALPRPGVYRARVRARGRTRKGTPFSRERALTVQVWRGGDRDAGAAAGRGDSLIDHLRGRDQALCELLGCLLGRGHVIDAGLERRLEDLGVDVRRLRACVERLCRPKASGERSSGEDA